MILRTLEREIGRASVFDVRCDVRRECRESGEWMQYCTTILCCPKGFCIFRIQKGFRIFGVLIRKVFVSFGSIKYYGFRMTVITSAREEFSSPSNQILPPQNFFRNFKDRLSVVTRRRFGVGIGSDASASSTDRRPAARDHGGRRAWYDDDGRR